MDATIFKSCDVQGVYPGQLSADDAWKIGVAAGRFLPSLIRGYDRGLRNTQSLCVGRDMRTHSAELAGRLTEGIRCAGVNVIDLGQIDTPQIYFAINHLKTCGGIQVTASHRPAQYNGFKISGHRAVPIATDTGLGDIQHLASSLLHTKGNPTGTITELDMTEDYCRHVLRFLAGNLRPLKVAIDASNGMAGKLIPPLFGGLSIDVVEINFEHSGAFHHDPDPLARKNLKELRSVVKEHKCDFGLCFDGDAERLTVLDEKGHQVANDHLIAIMVPYFLRRQPRAVVVYDLRCSRVVSEEIIKRDGTPRKVGVGQAFMKKAMRDTHAIFGGELSGRFYYQENFAADSGFITLVHLLNIVSESNRPLSELLRPLRRFHASGELSFTVDDKRKTMETLAKHYGDGKINHLDGITIDYKNWWFNCRSNSTEPVLRVNVEAKESDLLKEKVRDLVDLLGKPMGTGKHASEF